MFCIATDLILSFSSFHPFKKLHFFKANKHYVCFSYMVTQTHLVCWLIYQLYIQPAAEEQIYSGLVHALQQSQHYHLRRVGLGM